MSQRVDKTDGALYRKPRVARKRRRCDGHLTDRHWIEVGDLVVVSALPPDSDIGNTGWWHHWLCIDCAPVETVRGEPEGGQS